MSGFFMNLSTAFASLLFQVSKCSRSRSSSVSSSLMCLSQSDRWKQAVRKASSSSSSSAVLLTPPGSYIERSRSMRRSICAQSCVQCGESWRITFVVAVNTIVEEIAAAPMIRAERLVPPQSGQGSPGDTSSSEASQSGHIAVGFARAATGNPFRRSSEDTDGSTC